MSGRHAVTRTGSRRTRTTGRPSSHLPTASTNGRSSGRRSCESRSTSWPWRARAAATPVPARAQRGRPAPAAAARRRRPANVRRRSSKIPIRESTVGMVFGPMTRPGRRGYGRVLLAGDGVLGHTGLRAALAWTRDVGRLDRAADLREALERAPGAHAVVADLRLLCDGDLAANVAALRAAGPSPEVV